MEFLIGRQAILDRQGKTFGYELLYREDISRNVSTTEIDGNAATSRVIINAFINMGIEKIAKHGHVFINFTRDLILDRIYEMLPKEKIIVEVLEDVVAEEGILESLKNAKELGYTIALDDFVFLDHLEKLVNLADIIKIDFIELSKEQIKRQVEKYKRYPVKLLAEKVETEEDHKFALDLGFELFQGFYFTKPVIKAEKGLTPYQANIVRALKIINDPNSEPEELIELISGDIYLNTKLLTLVNSPFYGLKTKVKTVKKAISILGMKKTKEWLNVLLVSKLAENKPQELVIMSTVRAKFAELLSKIFALDEINAYYLGLFSLIHSILGIELEKILEDMDYLDNEVKDALLGKPNRYRELLDFIINYENGDFEKAENTIKKFNLEKENIYKHYLEAIEFADNIYSL